MKKRILSAIIAAIVAASSLSTLTYAEENYSVGGFKQAADQNAIAQAELDVQKAELDHRRAELAYQQLEAQLSGSTPSVDGDMNGDGKFALSDIIYLLDLYVENNANSRKYDFNKDGAVNLSDITSMLHAYVNR